MKKFLLFLVIVAACYFSYETSVWVGWLFLNTNIDSIFFSVVYLYAALTGFEFILSSSVILSSDLITENDISRTFLAIELMLISLLVFKLSELHYAANGSLVDYLMYLALAVLIFNTKRIIIKLVKYFKGKF